MSKAVSKEGEDAIAALESELAWMRMSQAPFGERLANADAAFKAATRPFMLSGDDRVLSKMHNAAGEFIEELALTEASRLAGGDADRETKRRTIERVKREAISVTWLPDGFRSSISAEMALVIAHVQTKG